MKRPETAAYLAKARQALKEARIVLANDLPEAAGRAAYLAAFHAAQAYIFEKTGRTTKTHGGVRGEFGRLAKSDPRIDRSFSSFLAQAYSFKEVADYAIGSNEGLTIEEAGEAIALAARFVESIGEILIEE